MKFVRYKAGLILGVFFALAHLGWGLLVVTDVAQPFMDWVLKIHFLNNPFLVQPFDVVTGGILLGITFVVGYMAGWLLALLLNAVYKK